MTVWAGSGVDIECGRWKRLWKLRNKYLELHSWWSCIPDFEPDGANGISPEHSDSSKEQRPLGWSVRAASVPTNAAGSRRDLQLALASHSHQELAFKAQLNIPGGPWPVFQVRV